MSQDASKHYSGQTSSRRHLVFLPTCCCCRHPPAAPADRQRLELNIDPTRVAPSRPSLCGIARAQLSIGDRRPCASAASRPPAPTASPASPSSSSHAGILASALVPGARKAQGPRRCSSAPGLGSSFDPDMGRVCGPDSSILPRRTHPRLSSTDIVPLLEIFKPAGHANPFTKAIHPTSSNLASSSTLAALHTSSYSRSRAGSASPLASPLIACSSSTSTSTSITGPPVLTAPSLPLQKTPAFIVLTHDRPMPSALPPAGFDSPIADDFSPTPAWPSPSPSWPFPSRSDYGESLVAQEAPINGVAQEASINGVTQDAYTNGVASDVAEPGEGHQRTTSTSPRMPYRMDYVVDVWTREFAEGDPEPTSFSPRMRHRRARVRDAMAAEREAWQVEIVTQWGPTRRPTRRPGPTRAGVRRWRVELINLHIQLCLLEAQRQREEEEERRAATRNSASRQNGTVGGAASPPTTHSAGGEGASGGRGSASWDHHADAGDASVRSGTSEADSPTLPRGLGGHASRQPRRFHELRQSAAFAARGLVCAALGRASAAKAKQYAFFDYASKFFCEARRVFGKEYAFYYNACVEIDEASAVYHFPTPPVDEGEPSGPLIDLPPDEPMMDLDMDEPLIDFDPDEPLIDLDMDAPPVDTNPVRSFSRASAEAEQAEASTYTRQLGAIAASHAQPSGSSQAPLVPEQVQNVQDPAAEDSRRLTLHAGHTPSHSLSPFHTTTATGADVSGRRTGQAATPSTGWDANVGTGGDQDVDPGRFRRLTGLHSSAPRLSRSSSADIESPDLWPRSESAPPLDATPLGDPVAEILGHPVMIMNIPYHDYEFFAELDQRLYSLSRGRGGNPLPRVLQTPTDDDAEASSTKPPTPNRDLLSENPLEPAVSVVSAATDTSRLTEGAEAGRAEEKVEEDDKGHEEAC